MSSAAAAPARPLDSLESGTGVPCQIAQSDGVPCAVVVADCEHCDRATGRRCDEHRDATGDSDEPAPARLDHHHAS